MVNILVVVALVLVLALAAVLVVVGFFGLLFVVVVSTCSGSTRKEQNHQHPIWQQQLLQQHQHQEQLVVSDCLRGGRLQQRQLPSKLQQVYQHLLAYQQNHDPNADERQQVLTIRDSVSAYPTLASSTTGRQRTFSQSQQLPLQQQKQQQRRVRGSHQQHILLLEYPNQNQNQLHSSSFCRTNGTHLLIQQKQQPPPKQQRRQQFLSSSWHLSPQITSMILLLLFRLNNTVSTMFGGSSLNWCNVRSSSAMMIMITSLSWYSYLMIPPITAATSSSWSAIPSSSSLHSSALRCWDSSIQPCTSTRNSPMSNNRKKKSAWIIQQQVPFFHQRQQQQHHDQHCESLVKKLDQDNDRYTTTSCRSRRYPVHRCLIPPWSTSSSLRCGNHRYHLYNVMEEWEQCQQKHNQPPFHSSHYSGLKYPYFSFQQQQQSSSTSSSSSRIHHHKNVRFMMALSLSSSSSSQEEEEESMDSTSNSNNDEEDWRAIIMAFRLYKAAYGDLKVPQRFIVPDLKPWPIKAHKMKLGKIVSSIRSTGKYIQNHPERKQLLDQLGFVWQQRSSRQLVSSTTEIIVSNPIQPSQSSSIVSTTGSTAGTSMNSNLNDNSNSNIRMNGDKKRMNGFSNLAGTAVSWQQVFVAVQAYQQNMKTRINPISSSSSTPPTTTSIPLNFVIPESREWPEEVQGMPLGQEWERIRKTILVSNVEAKEKFATIGMGILPVGGSSTTTTSTSSSISRTTPGTISAQSNPNRKAIPPAFKEMDKYIMENDEDNDIDLKESSGMSLLDKTISATAVSMLSANDVRFQNVFLALQTYRDIYGNVLVPQDFIVPSSDNSDDDEEEDSPKWPQVTWGLRLGARVNSIRTHGTFLQNNPERKQMLDELGFVWMIPSSSSSSAQSLNSPMTARGRRRANVMNDLDQDPNEVTYIDTNGSDSKGRKSISTGPMSSNDADLSLLSLEDLSGGDLNTDNLYEEDFGFDFDLSNNLMGIEMDKQRQLGTKSTSSSSSSSWNFEGATTPQASATNTEDPSSLMGLDKYLSPRTLADSLAEATTRAKDLGIIEGMTDRRRVIKGKREKDIPWFNDDFGDDFVFEDVVEALTVYKNIYGDFTNLSINDNDPFIVPARRVVSGFLDDLSNDDDDDNIFGSLDMGTSARAAAAIANYERDTRDTDRGQDMIASEIRRLQQEVDNTRSGNNLGTATAVTSQMSMVTSSKRITVTWPEHLAGMALGNIVRRIRDGSLEVKHIPSRKAQLDAIGFDWGDPKYFIDIPFEKAMCAMYAYYLIRGDTFILEDFIMPSEDPWPQALAGYEVGKAMKRLRQLQNFLEAYHPEKVSLLRMIDFVWFSDTMALPLDPNESEMTPEALLLGAMGHPDYAKMIDTPMGLPDRIVADGPFYETDDPKLWWRRYHNWDYVKDYWYQQGRRDNAYVLRRLGYPRMADEHEAKYGLGLLSQINATLNDLKQDESGNILLEGKTLEEKEELLETLNRYRLEMLECTDIHPLGRDDLLVKFDDYMRSIMKDPNLPKFDYQLVPQQQKQSSVSKVVYSKTDQVVNSNNNINEDESEMDEEEEFDNTDELDDDMDIDDELSLSQR